MRYINSLLLYLLTYLLTIGLPSRTCHRDFNGHHPFSNRRSSGGVQWVQMTHEQNTTQICTVDFYRMECQRGLATRKLFVKRVICDKTKESWAHIRTKCSLDIHYLFVFFIISLLSCLVMNEVVYITGHTVVWDLQISFEVALTAVRRPVKVWSGHTNATAPSPGAATTGKCPHVGDAVLSVVGALDTTSRTTDSTTIRRLVDDKYRVCRTGGVEVLPLADFMQRPLCQTHTRRHSAV